MKLIDYNRGHEAGLIPHTREHTRRLVKAGQFPAPIRTGIRAIAWDEAELIAHHEQRRVKVPAASSAN
jgi:hypothetical protein